MIFVYLVPSGFFIIEFLVMLFLGLGAIDNMLNPQTIVTIHCAFWATAAASLTTAVYVFLKARKSTYIDEMFSFSVFFIHMGVAATVFIISSLLLGGAAGGVVNEIFWFFELFIYVVVCMIYSFIICAIAYGIMKIVCFFVNRKNKKK